MGDIVVIDLAEFMTRREPTPKIATSEHLRPPGMLARISGTLTDGRHFHLYARHGSYAAVGVSLDPSEAARDASMAAAYPSSWHTNGGPREGVFRILYLEEGRDAPICLTHESAMGLLVSMLDELGRRSGTAPVDAGEGGRG